MKIDEDRMREGIRDRDGRKRARGQDQGADQDQL